MVEKIIKISNMINHTTQAMPPISAKNIIILPHPSK